MAAFTNTATLSYNGVVTSSNTTVGELLEQLSVTKTAVSPDYTMNDDITYVVSLVNTGTTPLNGITLTDNLGSYTFNTTVITPLDYVDNSVRYYVNGVLQPALTAVVGTDNLAISGISVPASGNALVIYEAKPNSFAPPVAGGSITNTVTATGDQIAAAVTDSENVTARNEASLSINKSMSPTVVTENGRLTYTLNVQNLGNKAVTADEDIIVADTFDPILKDISVTYNGTAMTEDTDYTYDTLTGEFTTLAGKITVPAATYTQNAQTGEWRVTPGIATVVISGTV